MSSAWSQGTSFRRNVTVPVTVSLVTTLKLVKSAMTCSSARTSMFWKFKLSFSPEKPGALHQLVRVGLHRPHFQHELVVGLVGAVLPRALRLDHHAHAVTALEGGDGLDRRGEVGHVHAAAQLLGQRRAQELHHQRLALLADVHAHLRARQVDDDAAGAVAAAAEVDLANGQRLVVLRRGKLGLRAGAGGHRAGRVEQHEHRLALQFHAVGGGLAQVQHQPGALTRLRDVGRAHVALVQLHRTLGQRAAHAGQVDGHTRRRLHDEAAGHGRQRLAEVHAHDVGAGLLRGGDRLDDVLCERGDGKAECQRQRGNFGAPLVHDAILQGASHLAFSCSCRVLARSIHSPAASCTISRSTIWVSVILVMRP